MKVIGFNASPRKGFNTETLVKKVLQGAVKKGAETKLYNLTKMDISPCRGCLACRRDMPCSIKDDMQEIIIEIKNSDAIVIGSPIYMKQMTAQAKAFIDRLYPLIKSDFTSALTEGTKSINVFTQATQDVQAFNSYFEHNESTLDEFGFAVEKTLVAGNTLAKGDLEKQDELLKKALEIGENLI